MAGAVVAFFHWGLNRDTTSSETAIHEPDSHSEHEGHTSPENDGLVHLSDDQLKQFGIKTSTAAPGKLQISLTLPGELVLNADRIDIPERSSEKCGKQFGENHRQIYVSQ